jgi:hypothetical protein
MESLEENGNKSILKNEHLKKYISEKAYTLVYNYKLDPEFVKLEAHEKLYFKLDNSEATDEYISSLKEQLPELSDKLFNFFKPNTDEEIHYLHKHDETNFELLSIEEKLKWLSSKATELKKQESILVNFPLKLNPKEASLLLSKEENTLNENIESFIELLNSTLDIEINAEDFAPYSTYLPETSEICLYLISQQECKFQSKLLNEEISFGKWEPIRVISKRLFGLQGIDFLVKQSGLQITDQIAGKENNRLHTILNKKA